MTKERQTLLASWAVAALKGGAQAKTLRAKIEKRPSPLAMRFGLDGVERRILEMAYAIERSIVAADAARAKGGLTVERLRALFGDEVDAALSPKRALRQHALVAVGAGGMAAAIDVVRLAPGLAARLDGAAEPDGLWLGCIRVLPGGRGDVPARIAALFGELGAAAATLLTLDGCPRREAHELALGLARHLSRGVLVVDGELLADAPDPALLLACARREADCECDVLVVCEAAALGERWRALLAPATGEASALVILADAERTRDPVAAAPFTVRRLSLHARPTPAATPTPPATEPRADDKPAPVDDGLDHIRQQAIRDAERALGIYRTPPPPPRAPVTPIPPRLAPQPQAQTQTSTPAQAPMQTRPPESPPPVASPAATPPAKKRSAKGAQYFGGETAEPPRPPAPPPPPAIAPIEGDGPALPIASDATVDELARVAMTSPSAAQRIALINQLRTLKSPAVVAMLRANANNQHPVVRAAAEAAMALLFGPNWNATRPIAKPVQPPPSDDKDRGPPGGW
ncbi:MAG: hypothetical protein ACXVAN_01855 [Polyangia bacterium]